MSQDINIQSLYQALLAENTVKDVSEESSAGGAGPFMQALDMPVVRKEAQKLKGGLADKLTLRDLAVKHAYDDSTDSTSKEKIQKMLELLKTQVEKGMKVEMEHTKDEAKAKEIVMDHLSEDPNYYSKLKKANIKEESKDESGLIVVGKTQLDNNAIGDIVEKEGYYAEWNPREGYWFFPEEEDLYDGLEKELDMQFAKRDINARFEGVFNMGESSVNEDAPILAGGKIKDNYAVSHFGFTDAPSIPNRKSKAMDYKQLYNEAKNYNQFAREVSTRPDQDKMHEAVKAVHRKLAEVNKMLEYANQLKSNLAEGEDTLQYKKRTKESLDKLKYKVAETYSKIKTLV